MYGFAQRAGQRRVDPVVVARGQVYGDEMSIFIRRRGGGIAEQFSGAEIETLGLEDAAVNDRAELADAAVGGAGNGVRIHRRAARSGHQRTREEGIETGIGERIRLLRLRHVNLVLFHHRRNQEVFPRPPRPARRPIDEARQQPMRQYILQCHARTHGQFRVAARVTRSAVSADAVNGGRNMPTSRACGSTITAEPL